MQFQKAREVFTPVSEKLLNSVPLALLLPQNPAKLFSPVVNKKYLSTCF